MVTANISDILYAKHISNLKKCENRKRILFIGLSGTEKVFAD